MSEERLNYDKPSYYSQKVLVGNWFEEAVGKFSRCKHKSTSTYETHYSTKYPVDKQYNDNIRNDVQIKSEHSDISPSRNAEQNQNYFDNFTTTYDLSYKYFPQWIHGTLDRKLRFALLKYEPTEEYLNSFGNLTLRNNLSDIKWQEWECDVLDPRRSVLSINQTDFIKFDAKEYKLERWPRPVPVEIKCGKATEIIYPQLPSNHPRNILNNCNPITWECNDKLDLKEKCVCKN